MMTLVKKSGDIIFSYFHKSYYKSKWGSIFLLQLALAVTESFLQLL